jgi:hypothetical protein
MAVLFPQIYDWIDKNPTKSTTLTPLVLLEKEGGGTESWDVFDLLPLRPSGTTSAFLVHQDSLYRMSQGHLRKQLLREKILELQQRADVELNGRKFPKKKIQEAFGRELSVKPNTVEPCLEAALAELFQIQKITINSEKKEISFFPEDLRNWSAGRPLLFTRDSNHFVCEPKSGEFSLSHLALWLCEKEAADWKIDWPSSNANLTILKEQMIQAGLQVPEKAKKEDLARRIGKHEAIQVLRKPQEDADEI